MSSLAEVKVGRMKKGGITFDIDSWNMYSNIVNNQPLTNNSAENFNSNYNALQVGKQNMYKCITGMKREFNISSIRLNQIKTSSYIEKHKERKLKLNEKYMEIRDIINSIDYDNLDTFFTNITPYVEMKKKQRKN